MVFPQIQTMSPATYISVWTNKPALLYFYFYAGKTSELFTEAVFSSRMRSRARVTRCGVTVGSEVVAGRGRFGVGPESLSASTR